jgi:hypothetical protein
MKLDKYRHWVVALYDNVDNGDDDEDDHRYSHYGSHHYLDIIHLMVEMYWI